MLGKCSVIMLLIIRRHHNTERNITELMDYLEMVSAIDADGSQRFQDIRRTIILLKGWKALNSINPRMPQEEAGSLVKMLRHFEREEIPNRRSMVHARTSTFSNGFNLLFIEIDRP